MVATLEPPAPTAPQRTAAPSGTHTVAGFLRRNPLFTGALLGLLAGLAARYAAGQEQVADGAWLAVLLLVGLPLVARTLREVVHGRFHADVIAALAVAGSIGLGEYLAGAVIVVMQTSGEALERYAFGRASGALDQLMARAPRLAHRLVNGQIEDIPAAEVRTGDQLLIKPGELVPVDARVTAGASSVDQSALTGEPVVVDVLPGDSLLSGSVNQQGALEAEAMRAAADSQYERIVTLVREAQRDRPPIQRLADRAAAVFTPVTLVMCAAGWLVTGEATTVLSVLVVATPCPLILAVPVAVFAGINRAAKHHAIVKHGAAIEQIGRARAVLFDKTGTLTLGNPEVTSVTALEGYHARTVLRLAAAVEQLSSHQLGRALAVHGLEQLGPLPVPEDFEEMTGSGVQGTVDGHRVTVGAPRRVLDAAQRSRLEPHLDGNAVSGTVPAVIVIDGEPAGIVRFSDRLRPGVPAMTAELHRLGVERLVMLTGDSFPAATAIATEAGIEDVRAELLPPDKVAAVREMKERYDYVIMAGDGTNDAPALATATVGVAMGARGTGISAEAADVVLLKDDITTLVDVMRAGRRMRRIALQSAGLGIGLSSALMVIAVFGLIPPTTGALLQEVIDITVVLNALRARGGA